MPEHKHTDSACADKSGWKWILKPACSAFKRDLFFNKNETEIKLIFF